MNTITYVARNSVGQYASNYWAKAKRIAKIIIKVVIITYLIASFLSLFSTYILWRAEYNVRCKVNTQVVGYLTTKEACGDIYTNWVASTIVPNIQ